MHISGLPETSWSRLRMFNYYRGLLTMLFLTVYLNDWTKYLVQPEHYIPALFYTVTLLYLTTFLLFTVSIYQRKPELNIQVMLQIVIDVATIVTLMHASGSIRSGFGMLLIISISMTGMYLPRQQALLFAAFASLAVLGEHFYSQMTLVNIQPQYTQAGLLGILIFATAFLTSYISTRLRETELLASRQSEDLESAVQMNEHVIRNMRTGIMVVSPDGTIQMANNSAENLLGNIYIARAQSLNKISPTLFTRFSEWREADTMVQEPIQQQHGLPDIQPGFSLIEPRKGKHSRTLIFLEDASQLNQRFQQVKLASLGRLTASIAHEIRNPLAAIHHASQLLEESTLDAADIKLTHIISTQVKRLNDVVESVLQLSRQQRGTPETIVLKQWLTAFRREYCSSGRLGEDQISIHIEPDSTRIQFNSGHLHQVLWNLCTNAINHSGVDTKELIISIQGGNTQDLNQPFLDIIDNGKGIDDDVAQQIFEPFFTTNQNGSGLGLYITKEVAESNRAKIRYIALPTGGTCFRIYFIQPAQN